MMQIDGITRKAVSQMEAKEKIEAALAYAFNKIDGGPYVNMTVTS